MRRYNLIEPQQLVKEEVASPEPGPGEVVIAVKSVGICGSDIHAYYGQHPYVPCPIVLGHEFSGQVTQVGADISKAWVGQRVTALPSLICGQCHNCRAGRFNICQNLKVIGCQTDGAMAEFVKAPADRLFHLPDDMSWEEGALVEPLAVAVHAVHMVGNIVGQRIVVYGGGTIGLCVLQAAKALGAKEAILSEPDAFRRNLAHELGADYVIDPNAVKPAEWLKNTFGPEGIDLAFECVGIESTIGQAILSNRKGTAIVVVGVFSRPVTVDLGLVQDRELQILGTLMYTKTDFSEALQLLSEGKVQGLPMITHRLELDDAVRAFDVIQDERDKCVKLMITANR